MTEIPREAPPRIANGSLCDVETPALLRRIASVSVRAVVTGHAPLEASVLRPEVVPNDFVLVDFEVRPGFRNYRLARLPRNDRWRIRIGAFERRVHRAFVVLARRIVRSFADRAASVQALRAGVVLLLHGAPGPDSAGTGAR